MGITFGRPEGFNIAHFGALWRALPPEFVRAEEQTPLLDGGQEVNLSDPPVRVWFLTDDGRKLVQVQKDRFILNWRRSEDGPLDYPEFETIYPEFESLLGIFMEFLKTSGLSDDLDVRQLEITYVNLVPENGIREIFPRVSDLLVDHVRSETGNRFLPEPQDFNWVTVYPLPDDAGILSVDARSARKVDPPNDRVIRLTLSARGVPNDVNDASVRDWFALAHDYVVKGFADVVSRDIQDRVWGRK